MTLSWIFFKLSNVEWWSLSQTLWFDTNFSLKLRAHRAFAFVKNSPFNEGLLCISKGQRMEWKAQIKVMVIGFRPFSTQLFVKFLTCQSGMWMKLCSIWFLLRCSIFLSSCWKCLINEKDSQFSPKITRTAINRTIFGISPSFVPFLLNDGLALLQFLLTL